MSTEQLPSEERLLAIRRAVHQNKGNLENAYADLAWLLAEYDRQQEAITLLTDLNDDLECELSDARARYED